MMMPAAVAPTEVLSHEVAESLCDDHYVFERLFSSEALFRSRLCYAETSVRRGLLNTAFEAQQAILAALEKAPGTVPEDPPTVSPAVDPHIREAMLSARGYRTPRRWKTEVIMEEAKGAHGEVIRTQRILFTADAAACTPEGEITVPPLTGRLFLSPRAAAAGGYSSADDGAELEDGFEDFEGWGEQRGWKGSGFQAVPTKATTTAAALLSKLKRSTKKQTPRVGLGLCNADPQLVDQRHKEALKKASIVPSLGISETHTPSSRLKKMKKPETGRTVGGPREDHSSEKAAMKRPLKSHASPTTPRSNASTATSTSRRMAKITKPLEQSPPPTSVASAVCEGEVIVPPLLGLEKVIDESSGKAGHQSRAPVVAVTYTSPQRRIHRPTPLARTAASLSVPTGLSMRVERSPSLSLHCSRSQTRCPSPREVTPPPHSTGFSVIEETLSRCQEALGSESETLHIFNSHPDSPQNKPARAPSFMELIEKANEKEKGKVVEANKAEPPSMLFVPPICIPGMEEEQKNEGGAAGRLLSVTEKTCSATASRADSAASTESDGVDLCEVIEKKNERDSSQRALGLVLQVMCIAVVFIGLTKVTELIGLYSQYFPTHHSG